MFMSNDNGKSTDLFAAGYSEDDKIIFQHPWKLSRLDCVLNNLRKRKLRNIADIGTNDMFYAKKLKSFADGQIYAVDIFFPEEGTVKDGIICVNDIEKLPENELDGMIMMDVLEHIENDKIFFNTVADKLKNNGIILITVPAWQFLFSAYDTKLGHFRRYNRKQLLALMKRSDIKIEGCHYFYTSLFFARLLSMLKRLLPMQKKDRFIGDDIGWKYSEKNIITILIKKILDIDYWINKMLDKMGGGGGTFTRVIINCNMSEKYMKAKTAKRKAFCKTWETANQVVEQIQCSRLRLRRA
jgi:hypothetical protein